MSFTAITPEMLAAAPGLARQLSVILLALGKLIARAFLRNPGRVALIVPLWNYIGRQSRRFARAMDQLGTPCRPASGRKSAMPSATAARLNILPRRRGWLVAELHHEAACFAGQLNHLLSQPEATAILAASPRAVRLLRPLCHMLGITPAALPPRPKRVREKKEASQRAGETAGRRSPLPSSPLPHPSWSAQADHPRLPVFLTASPSPCGSSSFLPQETPPRRNPPPCEHLANRWPWAPGSFPAKRA